MSLFDKVIKDIKDRRDKLYNNRINCIPSHLKRFRRDLDGVEQECMVTVTAFTKGAKSQFVSNMYIYNPLLYCYYKQNASIKIIYIPLEEKPDRILQRFISWLLYHHTNGEVRVSPKELRSTSTPCSDEVLELLESDEIKDIIKYFEDNVIFAQEVYTPTQIKNYCEKYALEHGSYITVDGKKEYIQDNPDEFRLVIVDTVNLVEQEPGTTLKQSMDKLSKIMAVTLRNEFKYSPIAVQQQTFEQEGNEAIKLGRMKPTVAGLGDSKYFARDSDMVLGLFSPARFGLTDYFGYNIAKFKDNIRFLEVCINRNGEMGGTCPLYFDGAVCEFKELPRPDNVEELKQVYTHLDKIREEQVRKYTFFTWVNKLITKFKRND